MPSIYMGVAWDDAGLVNADILDMEETKLGGIGTKSSIYMVVDLCNGACDM